VGPEALVALHAEPSVELLAGLLGVLTAGGAYVPLDPADPPHRTAFVLSDARPTAIVTQAHLADRLPGPSSLPGSRPVLPLEDCRGADGEEGETFEPQARPGNVAYVLYTSGSTGRPKGVMIEHASLGNYLRWAERDLLGDGLAIPVISRISFDASAKQLFAPLLSGRAVWMLPPGIAARPAELAAALGAAPRFALNCVPALWEALVAEIEAGAPAPPGLRRLLVGGEAFPAALATRSFALPAGPAIANLYGPTEATANASRALLRPAGRVTLGRPVAGARLCVLDSACRPLPIGLPGELAIAGPGLARGYLRQPGATAERFVPHPASAVPGDRLYRSGDRARTLAGGEIEFLGRLDRQLKIRGLRLEPAEIEAALLAHPAVEACAVVPWTAPGGATHLVAYLVPRPAAAWSAGALRRHLAARLPEPAIPAVFTALPALPRLAGGGKVDRRALAALAPPRQEGDRRRQPGTPSEELLAGIWAEVLGVREVGVEESFFALGGHSLLATRVMARLPRLFGVELPLSALFEHPTVAALAAAVDGALAAGAASTAPPILPAPRAGDLPLSSAQRRLWVLHQLEPASPVYNLPAAVRLRGRLDPALLQSALDRVVRRHEALRTTLPAPAGEPVQRIDPPRPVRLPRVDLTGIPAAEGEARRLAGLEARRPFDLGRGPLFRCSLLAIDAEDHALLLTLHHVAADAWSMRILVREVAALYRAAATGVAASLPELPIQVADFALWQRRRLASRALDGALAFWRRQLAGAPRRLELPADRPRPAIAGFSGGEQRLQLGADLTGALAALGRREGATLFMALLAGFAALLCRWTGGRDLVVGSPVAGRDRLETEGLIGFFVNLLALRLRPVESLPFRQLLAEARRAALAAFAHREVPFDQVVEALGPEREPSHTPLCQVVLALEEEELPLAELPGVALEVLAPATGTSKFDLTLSLARRGEGLAGTLEWSRERFDSTTVARLAAHLRTLLAGIAAAPERTLAERSRGWRA
jgi:amino acid adenylation domain-containing protein